MLKQYSDSHWKLYLRRTGVHRTGSHTGSDVTSHKIASKSDHTAPKKSAWSCTKKIVSPCPARKLSISYHPVIRSKIVSLCFRVVKKNQRKLNKNCPRSEYRIWTTKIQSKSTSNKSWNSTTIGRQEAPNWAPKFTVSNLHRISQKVDNNWSTKTPNSQSVKVHQISKLPIHIRSIC